MKIKLTLLSAALLLSLQLLAQTFTGGVKGTVVDRAGRMPIQGASLTLSRAGETIATAKSGQDGAFFIENLDNGMYDMTVTADGFAMSVVNVTVDNGFIKDMMYLSLVAVQQVEDVDDSSFSEFDMQDSGYTDNPTILFQSNDVFSNVAGYGFSSVRFKSRGYDSEKQEVLLAGVKLNDAITGYSPYSLWSGLNEAMRAKETTMGNDVSDYAIGGYNGVTNILAVPSSVRPGWRFSVLSNSALYRLRLMANYASGELDNGWSYAVNASARLGGNDWIEGVFYRSFSLYAGIEKKINDANKLALMAFAAPGQRGAQNASTQEVYDMMGDNMYNSNWGYQAGKVRNSRVRNTFEPVFVLKYTATPSTAFEASATLLYRTGSNGYTALDWYDAMDPRPDYYRNLPSYAFNDDDDYGRINQDKADWSEYAWTKHNKACQNYQHLDWDRLYNVNYNNTDGRSKYALEERHVDQNDLNFAGSFKWFQTDAMVLTGGINGRWNRTENYKKLYDLLGGKYFLNTDQFAERDFAASEARIQNDLDYYLENGSAKEIKKGGKYGYDYYAFIRKYDLWINQSFTIDNFSGNVALSAGYDSFWREGLMRKGLFAGLDDNGKEIIVDGIKLTSYDSDGKVISSKGKSDKVGFFTYSAKAGLAYLLGGSHRFSANAGYFTDAPTFSQAFYSARTRNSIVPNLTTTKTISTDVNYQFNSSGYSLRLTGYWTKIMDQTDVMSFYDDSQQSFTNFAMTGIAQRHMGIELGVKVPLFVQGLTASGVLSWGEFIYVKNRGKNPWMVQTVDNNAEIIRDEEVPYWVTNPVFKKVRNPADGQLLYDEDLYYNPIVIREQKHYVPSTPQLAAELALNYRTNSYWFFEVNGQYFANSYLDMNPLYRTAFAVQGPDGIASPAEIEYMTRQENLFEYKDKNGKIQIHNPFLLNLSAGKSWYINRTYNFGFSLEVKNILNNKGVKTGGYEQTRLISSSGKDSYYRFDPKYFYMYGANYMLNLYFRF